MTDEDIESHRFHGYLLRASCGSGSVLGSVHTAVSKADRAPALGADVNKQEKYVSVLDDDKASTGNACACACVRICVGTHVCVRVCIWI